MQYNDQIDNNLFNLDLDAQQIMHIARKKNVESAPASPVLILEKFSALLRSLLDAEKKINGIVYHCPIMAGSDDYRVLFEEAKSPDFTTRMHRTLATSVTIKQANIPVVAVLDGTYNSLQMAPVLWAHQIICTALTKIRFSDCSLGIFPGLGTTVHAARRMAPEEAAELLLKGTSFKPVRAVAAGLIDMEVTDSRLLRQNAVDWVLVQIEGSKGAKGKRQAAVKQISRAQLDQRLAPYKKKANLKFPGTRACFEILSASLDENISLEDALQMEGQKYTAVLQNPSSLAIMRTMHYGIMEAKRPSNERPEPDQSAACEFSKTGIIGAGMMGAGIAFEVARAGMQAVLKDTTLELAQKGKAYTTKCCEKLIAMGKMTTEQKVAMEALIEPTDKIAALQDVDCIIEAVFEQEALKNTVIQQSEPKLSKEGFFASNTTSLPISRLALMSRQPANFIGMHFFSPVDRMPLVEIILGKQTSPQTLQKAKALALKLGKIPIIVHDSPAFFTSRIFFNYLLEAITMLREGIPAADIEKEALNAGFAVSPLAVLDEISLPLMVHVYHQLPTLSNSQQRAYKYLQSMIQRGRTGRKSNKGFYQYDPQTGKKECWLDESLEISEPVPDISAASIQKRLLHVMALDSYRCLDEGVLNKPIDGDIGSILGVGYAAHTGGVFAHIDQTGISQFVKDCKAFGRYGEQWQVPDSLIDLANNNFRFYNGFTSNWPLTKG